MSYQVLARKWRPQNFDEMVGQKHVLRALTTALDEDRLHHAYLFTGTRGVGKTTVARIFAKCLNCEKGVSAHPCGECQSCQEITQGRHVDLIEVDAASRTKVEDTRELLDNVQYAPTRGRFKIYLIDEVHMLSGHSFNALLKTLEEPPGHVKFLFATTDPQKLPVTVLSRCLQFNLKRMSQDLITGHLQQLLQSESVDFQSEALQLLARAADGSMRDALSLTDQAIVTGGGEVNEETTRDMLGLLPQGLLAELLLTLLNDDAAKAFELIESLGQISTDFTQTAENLLSSLHQIAVRQVVPTRENDELTPLVERFTPADVQLYYQIALHGRRDLPLAPDVRSGFEMMVLRMLAFRLDDGKKKTPELAAAKPVPQKQKPLKQAMRPESELPVLEEPPARTEVPPEFQAASAAVSSPPVPAPIARAEKKSVVAEVKANQAVATVTAVAEPRSEYALSPSPPPSVSKVAYTRPKIPQAQPSDNAWHDIVPQLSLSNMAQQIAQNSLLAEADEQAVTLRIAPEDDGLRTASTDEQMQQALQQYYQRDIKLSFVVEALQEETPAIRLERRKAERQIQAIEAIEADPLVQQLQQEFGAVIVPGSVRPRDA